MVLQKVGWGCMDRIDMAQDRDRWWALVNAVMNLRAPKNAWSLLTSSGITRFSRRALVHGIGMCLVTIKYAIFIQMT
jgi:hypothetical protein